MTWEEAVLWARHKKSKAFVEACYFHENLTDAANAYLNSAEFHLICKWLGMRNFKRSTLLDIGAGNGIASYAFAKTGAKVTALEPDPSFIVGSGAIRELTKGMDVDISELEMEDFLVPEKYDFVFSRQLIHHARDLDLLCRRASEALKPGGQWIAVREHVLSSEGDLSEFLNRHPLHHLYGGEYAYTLERYLGAFNQAGLIVERILTPLESPINYFPESVDQTKKRVRSILAQQGKSFLSKFLRLFPPKFVIRYFGKKASDHWDEPGRMYSFILSKKR